MATVKKMISLDEEIAKELEIVAQALHTTQKEIVERALDFYFDYTDSVVADKILDDIKEGKVRTFTQDEAYKILGIKDECR